MKIEPPTPLSTLIVTSIVYTLVAALQIMLGIFTQLSAFTYIFVLLIIALIYINDKIHKAEQLLRSITNQQAFNKIIPPPTPPLLPWVALFTSPAPPPPPINKRVGVGVPVGDPGRPPALADEVVSEQIP
jgi:hypothetical protein